MGKDDAAAESTEQWLPVAGWEGWYEVSSLGHVRRVRAGMGTRAGLLHPTAHVNGSLCVMLSRPDAKRQAMVHCLVAAAFLGPCPAHHRLDWKSGVHSNNRADNLRYRLRSDAPPTGPRRSHRRALTDEEVREIRRLLATTPGTDLARRYGVSSATIYQIRDGETYREVADDPAELPPE